ncbi:MAG: redox-regulated ATPase YchF [Thermoproteota archaeon]|nr:redox-regulated ATPase YchF [Thermoproteota archaeon]
MLLGLIGKANVGKSTFFNAATDLDVQCGNYPFTTISPNVGITYARVRCVCREFGIQDNPVHSLCIDGIRFIPVRLMDIAGLIPGASKGKGLGNKFLDDARQADALIHVVDAAGSTDSEGRPVTPGTGDPLSDVQFVEEEFDQWLASMLTRDWNKLVRDSSSQSVKLEHMISARLSGLSINEIEIAGTIGELVPSAGEAAQWSEDKILRFSKKLRVRSKPIVVAANKADLQSAEHGVHRLSDTQESVVRCSSELELLLRRATKKKIIRYLPGDGNFRMNESASINEQQKRALQKAHTFLSRYGSTGVQEAINTAVFNSLKFIVVYPVEDELKLTDKKGNVLPDAHLLPANSTPRDLAEKIHAEIGKGFLYAIDARSKMRLGADYRLKNNDVIKIVSATRSGRR